MDDLISRQQAIDALEAYAKKYNAYPIAVYDAVGVLQRVPPAQPEIIRCKDCKHLFNKDDEGGKCWHFNGFSKVASYDDFCSRAERRTDGID